MRSGGRNLLFCPATPSTPLTDFNDVAWHAGEKKEFEEAWRQSQNCVFWRGVGIASEKTRLRLRPVSARIADRTNFRPGGPFCEQRSTNAGGSAVMGTPDGTTGWPLRRAQGLVVQCGPS